MRILLIEDEDSIRNALQRALERDGHEVRAAASLGQARSLLAGWQPGFALSDLKLPDGDGLDLACSLGIPFMMISGYATFDDAVRAMRGGAVDFLTKPVAIRDVRAVVERQGGRSHPSLGASWHDVDSAFAAVREVVGILPGRLARLAAAELVQAAVRGSLRSACDERGTRLWLDAAVDWDAQALRRSWLAAHGVELVSVDRAVIASIGPEEASVYDIEAERIWPEELVLGRNVQARGWLSVGSWLLAAIRAGAGPFVGMSDALAAACRACGVSVPTAPADLLRPGVGPDERAALMHDRGA